MTSVNEWVAALQAELARRGTLEQQAADRVEEARQWLADEYDRMEQRLRSSPGWHEPTAAERREAARAFNRSIGRQVIDEDDV